MAADHKRSCNFGSGVGECLVSGEEALRLTRFGGHSKTWGLPQEGVFRPEFGGLEGFGGSGWFADLGFCGVGHRLGEDL